MVLAFPPAHRQRVSQGVVRGSTRFWKGDLLV